MPGINPAAAIALPPSRIWRLVYVVIRFPPVVRTKLVREVYRSIVRSRPGFFGLDIPDFPVLVLVSGRYRVDSAGGFAILGMNCALGFGNGISLRVLDFDPGGANAGLLWRLQRHFVAELHVRFQRHALLLRPGGPCHQVCTACTQQLVCPGYGCSHRIVPLNASCSVAGLLQYT